jgi:hypothetical protein
LIYYSVNNVYKYGGVAMRHYERGESSLTFSVLLGLLTGVIAIAAFITGRTTAPEFFVCTSQDYVPTSSANSRLLLRDDGYLLDQPTVVKAAEPLISRGAIVSIYTFSPETTVYDRVEQSKRFKDLLELDDLTSNPNMISIYLTCYLLPYRKYVLQVREGISVG